MSDFVVKDDLNCEAVIKVVGVGGGGGNAVDHMMSESIHGVHFININTDSQALKKSTAHQTVQVGSNITRGLGAGSNPEAGAQAAEADKDSIKSALEGADMLFIAAGMGGGTGTGAAPVVAEIARAMDILTVAVVTKPFLFEGAKRTKFAEKGIENLARNVDSLIVIPNEKLLGMMDGISLLDAFAIANNVLYGAVQGIAELITRPGMMNVDFADVRTVMTNTGVSMMGTGVASGADRAREATMQAIESPLLEDVELTGARGVLVNITCGSDLSITEFAEVGRIVGERASDDATVKVGTVIDDELDGEMVVTVVATGLDSPSDADQEEQTIVSPALTASQEHTSVTVDPEVVVEPPAPKPKKGDVSGFRMPNFLRS